MIAEKVSRRLGIYNDLRKTMEERLLDPRSPDQRFGNYLYEEDRFYYRIVDFNENIPTYDDTKQKEPENPEPAPEPTIENLAMLWGAKKGNLK